MREKNTLHVVFGTGPAGRAVAAELLRLVDHSQFAAAFGGSITGWDEILDTTLASYRPGQ
jgi:hypothetical protein